MGLFKQNLAGVVRFGASGGPEHLQDRDPRRDGNIQNRSSTVDETNTSELDCLVRTNDMNDGAH